MILIVAGVSGSGKSTVGAMLADRLQWRFADGDAFHPAANIAKMSAAIPLTDRDRWPWLRAIAAWMDERIARGESAVVACSALKRSYRDILLGGRPQALLIWLAEDRDLLVRRLAARTGHFFPERLLATQFAAYEPLQPDEHAISIAEGPDDRPADMVAKIVGLVWPGDGTGASVPRR